METKLNLAKAVIAVMKAVKGIDKSMTVGTGTNSYKGVSDKDVKNAVGKAMEDNGLCLLPIAVDAKTQIDRWEETNQYGTKSKQSVLTEVTTKYLLLHESGESVELAGYGHGIDSQDKAAGKATTYALKNTLLYSFLVPTGTIDDTDTEHSDSKPVPPAKAVKEPTTQQKVAMMNNLPIVLTEAVRADIKAAATTGDLTAIWNNNKGLQTDENFISIIKDRRSDLTPVTA